MRTPKPKLLNIKKMIANICALVLILPGHAAAITSPLPASSKRKPVTASSRHKMIATPQAGTEPRTAKKINAVITNNLSAKGSANFPKLVTKWLRRAICPSAKSVKQATMKMITPTNQLVATGSPNTETEPAGQLNTNNNVKIGIKMIRISVNLFGKFTLNYPHFPL